MNWYDQLKSDKTKHLNLWIRIRENSPPSTPCSYALAKVEFFYFFDQKDFLRPIWCVELCKIVFVFWYSHMITYFEFRIFVVILNTIFNISIWLTSAGFILIVRRYVMLHLSTISSNFLMYTFFDTALRCFYI